MRKQLQDYIGSEHHTIECSEEDFIKAISDVIYNIESYDTTTVRASVGNYYLVAKYIVLQYRYSCIIQW